MRKEVRYTGECLSCTYERLLVEKNSRIGKGFTCYKCREGCVKDPIYDYCGPCYLEEKYPNVEFLEN